MHLALISASFLLVIARYAVESADPFCDDPPDIGYASLSENSDEAYSIGTTVTYECQYGYVVSGNNRNLKCIRNGNEAEWTKPQFTCIPQSCGDPGLVRNGQRVGSLFTFPNSVSYHCEPGYKLLGIGKRYCQTNGQWSGRLPVCEVILCSPPKDPDNGQVTVSSFDYGSELHYTCDKGYRLNTEETVYCTEDGRWSNPDVNCVETVCEILETPEFGSVHFRGSEDRPRAGSIAVFSCKDGKIADGPTTSKCLDTGIWTFPPPKCLEPCSIPYVANGEIGKYFKEGRYKRKVFRQMNFGIRVEDYEELVLRCFEGFEVANSADQERTVSCGKAKWSIEPICKPASCRSKVPFAANAEVVNTNPEHGGAVSYECIGDYKKEIDETIVCDHGKWIGDPPTCKSTRCYVDTLKSSGFLKGYKSYYRDGEVFHVTCDPRFRLASASSDQITCNEGTWTGNLNPCIPANCLHPPRSIEHGRVTAPYSLTHGSILKFTCDEFYVPVGGTLVQCTYGQWEGKPPQCQDSRCYVSELKNKNRVSTISQPVTLSGNRLKVVCEEGYSPKSKQMPLCLNGLWQSDYEPLCEESECEVPRIARGSIKEEIFGDWYWNWSSFRYEKSLEYRTIQPRSLIPSGKILWFHCDKPFSVHGNRKERVQIKCVRGTWSTELQCLRDGERLITTTESSNFNRITSAPYTTTVKYLSSSTQSTVNFEWTSPASIDEPKPDIFVTSLPSQETPKEECFCVYSLEDSNIVAHADGRQLIYGDRVRNGSSVVFHCLHVGYHRFNGYQEITCNDCKPWDYDEFPICSVPEKGDAAILFDKNINVLPGGNIEIRKGQSVNLTCFAMETAVYPDWTSPESPSISLIGERRERKNYGDVVYLTHLEILNADYEHEGSYECSVDGDHKTMLQVVITDPNLRCPELPEDGSVIIRYDMERREHSKVSFSCPKEGQELIGKPELICLRSGQWSDTPPQCSGVRCKRITTGDLLQVDYSRNREVGSYAAFHCPVPGKRTGVSLTRCLEDGTWEDPTPTCKIPDCTVNDLLASVSQDVVPLVDNINKSSLPYNSTVKLTCANDMVAVGNPEAKCGDERKWKIDSVECAYGCQQPSKPPSSKLILNPELSLYKIGERLTLSCPPGMVLDNESQVIMCMTYGWTEPILPSCIERNIDKNSSGDKRNTNQAVSES